MGCLVVIIGLWFCAFLWSIHPVVGIFGVLFLIGMLSNRD